MPHSLFELNSMSEEQLRTLAESLDIKGTKKMDSAALGFAILDKEAVIESQKPASAPDNKAKKRGRPRKEEKPAPAAEKPAAPAAPKAEEKPAGNRKKKQAGNPPRPLLSLSRNLQRRSRPRSPQRHRPMHPSLSPVNADARPKPPRKPLQSPF